MNSTRGARVSKTRVRGREWAREARARRLRRRPALSARTGCVYKQGRILCVPYKTNHRTGKREPVELRPGRRRELVGNLADSLSSNFGQTELRNEIYRATFLSLDARANVRMYIYIFRTMVFSLLKTEIDLSLLHPCASLARGSN